MNALETALMTLLNADAAVVGTGRATGAYMRSAPPTATWPFVIGQQMSGADAYTFKSRFWEPVYLLKAVAQGRSAITAQAIAEAIDTALNGVALTVTGWTWLQTLRLETVGYEEPGKDFPLQHAGGLYRFWLQQA